MKNDITSEISIEINAPAAKVWQALTDPLIIKQYFFGTKATSDWKPGRPVTFKGEYEGQSYEDKGTVLDADEPVKLRYSYWSSMGGMEDKPENYMNITYDLVEKDGGTTLTMTQDNIKDEKTKEHSAANWKSVLEQMKKIVEGH